MKTISKIQKTGNRNIRNFNMKAFVVFTSVAVFSFIFPANAGNSVMPGVAGNTYPSNTVMASVTDAANLSGSFMETASEESMEVENWMTNPENFMQTAFNEENDPALEVQDWMLNENIWGL